MQYYRAVNKTKKEVVCPWCLGDDAGAPEWSLNVLGAIRALHLPSDDGNGREHDGGLFVDRLISPLFERAIEKGIPEPKGPIERDLNSILGRWAGDDVFLVGNPELKEYQDSFGYRNISLELATTWNRIVGDEDMQLEYRPDCECEPVATAKV
jgi:hypothetical protein